MNLLTLLVRSSFEKRCQQTKGFLETYTRQFEDEARVTIDEITITSHREIDRRLPQLSVPAQSSYYSTVSMPRNDFFSGRQDVLSQLHELIRPGDESGSRRLKSCVLHGLGGTGKTQTALEYTYRYRGSYRYIFWLPSESGPELANIFGSIASMVGLAPAGSSGDLKMNIQLSWKWLSETGTSAQCQVSEARD